MWTDLPEFLHIELSKPDNQDIVAELTDEKFLSRQHYSRATYAEGCHGPLCKKSERDRGRERNEERAQAAGRKYKPNENTRDAKRDGLLILLIDWHINHPDQIAKRIEARAVPTAS